MCLVLLSLGLTPCRLCNYYRVAVLRRSTAAYVRGGAPTHRRVSDTMEKARPHCHPMDLEAKIKTLPTRPGVYLYKDASDTVIYVGKAKNLRSRVRSYLLEASQANAKTGSLMREAVDLDYILVDNEQEALALENNLIKQKQPRFNILLRDDKSYPYVKLTMRDRHPKVFVTRRLRKDGGAYYGPYFPGNLAYRIAELLRRSFLLPSCKVDLSRYHPRPCLQYYIKRCSGPCVEGLTTPELYGESVRDAQMFLEGRGAELGKRIEQRMAEAAEKELYELAAKYRDLLSTVDQLQEKQRKRHARGQPFPCALWQDRGPPRVFLGGHRGTGAEPG